MDTLDSQILDFAKLRWPEKTSPTLSVGLLNTWYSKTNKNLIKIEKIMNKIAIS